MPSVGFAPRGYQLVQVHIVLGSEQLPSIPVTYPQSLAKNGASSLSLEPSGAQAAVQSFHQDVKKLPQNVVPTNVFKFHNKSFENLSWIFHQTIGHHLKLGEHFRKVYIGKWNLEKSKIRPKHFSLSSDQSPESYSSLLANMYLFLSKDLFQNIKIDTFKFHPLSGGHSERGFPLQSQTDLLQIRLKLENLHAKHVNNSIQDSSVFRMLSSNYSKVLSPGVNNNRLLETYLSHICSNRSIPCQSDVCNMGNTPVSTDDIDAELNVVIKKFLNNLARDGNFVKNSDLYVLPYLHTLITRLHKGERLFERVFVHSADNMFILHLLSALRYNLLWLPRQGSRVVFELYRSTDTHDYFIRILYNGKDITHSIPLCKSKGKGGQLCKVKYFADFHTLKHNSLLSQ